jgi:hypothetical protein
MADVERSKCDCACTDSAKGIIHISFYFGAHMQLLLCDVAGHSVEYMFFLRRVNLGRRNN